MADLLFPSPRTGAAVDADAIVDELIGLQRREPQLGLDLFQSLVSARQYRALYRLLQRFVPPGATVLDWGCGNGHFSYVLDRLGYRAHGYSFGDVPLVRRHVARVVRRGVPGSHGGLVEGIQPRDRLSQDEGMHVVRPFVGVHRLEVCEVAHRLVFREDAIRPEEAAGLTRDVGRDVDIVPLGERDLLGCRLAVVLEPAELHAEEPRLRDLGEHLREPRLLQLEPTDRLPEHQAVLGVADRFIVAGHRGAYRAPGDPVTRLGEAQQG